MFKIENNSVGDVKELSEECDNEPIPDAFSDPS